MENLIPVGLFILCLAGAVALLALAYFLYILVKIIRNTVNEKVNPMLDDAADLIKQAKPIVGRVDPLMDRITLTIDGANLQIMRIDQIMGRCEQDHGQCLQSNELGRQGHASAAGYHRKGNVCHPREDQSGEECRRHGRRGAHQCR